MRVDDRHGNAITDGLPSSTDCDAGMQAAQRIADQRGETVYVTDDDSTEYTIEPAVSR